MICCSELHLCQTDVLECMSVLRLTSSPAVDSAMSILSVPHYSLIFSGTVYDHVVLQDITLTEHVWRGWKQIYGEKIWLPITYKLVCVCVRVCVRECTCACWWFSCKVFPLSVEWNFSHFTELRMSNWRFVLFDGLLLYFEALNFKEIQSKSFL